MSSPVDTKKHADGTSAGPVPPGSTSLSSPVRSPSSSATGV